MGNKVSHDESSDREDGQNGGLRDMFKQKRQSLHKALSSSPKTYLKEESLTAHRDSNSQLSNVTDSESDLHLASSSPGLKPDGINKLAKELIIHSHDEEECDGIGLNTFSKYLCQGNKHLGQALFKDAIKCGKASKKASSSVNNSTISKDQFVAWSQKLSQLIGDENQLAYYVQIFANDEDMLDLEDVSHFIQSCYQLSFTKENLEFSEENIQQVLSAMFHGKNVLGSKYVIHWIEVNCPRVVIWMHRNLVHQLTVGFRRLQKKREEKRENETDRERNTNPEVPAMDANLQQELFSYLAGSPSSSKSPLFKSLAKQLSETSNEIEQLLSVTGFHQMQIWLLGCTLPLIFTRPQQQKLQHSPSVNGIVMMDPHAFITRMIASQNPTHWTLLYNSDNDGLSLNRFEHHVMGYRGPTVVFLRAEGNRVFCVAVDQSWKESIHFWGTSNTVVLQLSPEYRILDRGEKLMYYNTSARGYPFGLHIGSDHRDPQVAIDKEFSVLSHRKIPYRLDSIQVWGCGSMELRESQLDHKKWEMKQVEKSRQVKLSAVDWNDHPDRHLLDLAGHRQNYSQFGNA